MDEDGCNEPAVRPKIPKIAHESSKSKQARKMAVQNLKKKGSKSVLNAFIISRSNKLKKSSSDARNRSFESFSTDSTSKDTKRLFELPSYEETISDDDDWGLDILSSTPKDVCHMKGSEALESKIEQDTSVIGFFDTTDSSSSSLNDEKGFMQKDVSGVALLNNSTPVQENDIDEMIVESSAISETEYHCRICFSKHRVSNLTSCVQRHVCCSNCLERQAKDFLFGKNVWNQCF